MKHLKIENQADKNFKHQYTLDRVTKIVKNFKSVGIKISEFSRRENIPARILYELSSNHYTNGVLDEIVNALKRDYPKEYAQIEKIMEVTEWFTQAVSISKVTILSVIEL